MLRRLQPIDLARDRFSVAATAPRAFTGKWSLTAYALCAAKRYGQGWQIVAGAPSSQSPATFKSVVAVCPSGKRVVGTGAAIGLPSVDGYGRVGLQLSRASGPRDISRATARVNGYHKSWGLRAFAICASSSLHFTAEGKVVGASGATYSCSKPSHRLHSVGGGGSLTDSGPVFLQALRPWVGLHTAQVVMTGRPRGGITVQAVCGA